MLASARALGDFQQQYFVAIAAFPGFGILQGHEQPDAPQDLLQGSGLLLQEGLPGGLCHRGGGQKLVQGCCEIGEGRGHGQGSVRQWWVATVGFAGEADEDSAYSMLVAFEFAILKMVLSVISILLVTYQVTKE